MTASRDSSSSKRLGRLVDAIGQTDFGGELIGFISGLCDADHCAAFRSQGEALTAVALSAYDSAAARMRIEAYVQGQFWRRDTSLGQAVSMTATHANVGIRQTERQLSDDLLRSTVYPKLVDRLLLCGRLRNELYLISILRLKPHAPFCDNEVALVFTHTPLLTSVVAKHCTLLETRTRSALSFDAVEEIERTLTASTDLPRREMEVCARPFPA